MKVKAVRLHAANDLRLDTFELPEIKDDEILVKVVCEITSAPIGARSSCISFIFFLLLLARTIFFDMSFTPRRGLLSEQQTAVSIRLQPA